MRVFLVEHATGVILKDFELNKGERVIKVKRGARVKAVEGNFIKVYKAKKKTVLGLSGVGAKVFLYFLYNFSGVNNGVVNYTHSVLGEALGFSEKTAMRGVAECEERGILKRRGRTIYLNPTFALTGIGMPEEAAEVFGLEE